jgi:cytochrome c oxidase assembly protein subunit 15
MSLTSFQRLALWTTATTYLLIVVGGLVRASGAGLGCPDWPRCFGSWIPPASAAELPAGFDPSQFNPTLMWTEYLNRLLGVSVGFLILATLVSAIRHHRRTGPILWPTLAAFLLVGFQGWLGGVVVQQELAGWIVTVHLVVALVIVSLLLYATVYAFFLDEPRPSAVTIARRKPLSWAVLALIVLTLAQVALGAQVREHVDTALDAGTGRTVVVGTVGVLYIWHREMALLVLALAAGITALIRKRHAADRALTLSGVAVIGLVAAQLGLGLAMAYVALTPVLQIGHLTSSSLLLGAETVLWLLPRWLPDSGNTAAGRGLHIAKEFRHASIM